MIQRIKYGILVCLVAFSLPGYSQIKEAKSEMALFNYTEAIKILNGMLDKKGGQNDTAVLRLLADCYRFQNDVPNARFYYGKVIAAGQKQSTTVLHYAYALRSNGEYLAAKQRFLEYDSLTGRTGQGRLLAGYCDSAIRWISAQSRYEIAKVNGINSPQSEFGLAPFNDGYLMSSDRVEPEDKGDLYGWTGHPYLRIYIAGSDSAPTRFHTPIPEEGLTNIAGHDGPVSFCKATGELFITRTIQKSDKGKKDGKRLRTHLLKIFISSKTGGKWNSPEPFFLNSDVFSVGHPSISPDGQKLYFVSDMPGGFGQTDIYCCTRKEGKWGAPENLGKAINSAGKEMFPSLTGDRLFFASDGQPGLGGLDLFVSTLNGDKWSVAKNVGTPLNSSYDDFSICLSDTSESGYFSSNRPGGMGNDDIYYFFKKLPVPKPVYYVSGYVREKSTLAPIPHALVYFLDESSDSVLILKSDSNGFFRTLIQTDKTYKAKATKGGYFPDCLSFAIHGVVLTAEVSLPRPLLLDRMVINKTYPLSNIYYTFDKWNIRDDAKPSLDNLVRIMIENPVRVELGSHTDCRGTSDYNQKLSQRRAESAVQYIINNGIAPSRISAKGYGESQLVNGCSCESGVSCSEEEHQLNRRTEFKITTIEKEFKFPGFVPEMLNVGDVISIRSLPEGFFVKCD
jgi:hypothetical protein